MIYICVYVCDEDGIHDEDKILESLLVATAPAILTYASLSLLQMLPAWAQSPHFWP